MEVGAYKLYRLVNDRFQFFFDITEEGETVGTLKFGLYTDTQDTNYVYLKAHNHILYNRDRLERLLCLPERLNLAFNNYTALDIALDSTVNIPSLIKRLFRDKDITTILNGKAVTNRKATLPGLFFEYSSSLDKLANPTVTLKQKKAEQNKNAGIVIQAYDKKREIENKSGKYYILDNYGNPKRLFRLEIRMHYQEIKDYFYRMQTMPTADCIFDDTLLENMFFYHLSAVLRFTRGRKKLHWVDLIRCNGRV